MGYKLVTVLRKFATFKNRNGLSQYKPIKFKLFLMKITLCFFDTSYKSHILNNDLFICATHKIWNKSSARVKGYNLLMIAVKYLIIRKRKPLPIQLNFIKHCLHITIQIITICYKRTNKHTFQNTSHVLINWNDILFVLWLQTVVVLDIHVKRKNKITYYTTIYLKWNAICVYSTKVLNQNQAYNSKLLLSQVSLI